MAKLRKGPRTSVDYCKAVSLDGRPCRRVAVREGYCGIHLRYSADALDAMTDPANSPKYAFGTLAERYERSLRNSDFLSSRHEIALIDARLQSLVERAESDIDDLRWNKFVEMWRDFIYYIQAGDTSRQNSQLAKLNGFVDKVETTLGTWSDIESSIKLRSRTIETELKRLQMVQDSYTSEQVLSLLGATILALKEVVYKYADPNAAKNIILEASEYHRRLVTQDDGLTRQDS